MLGKNLAAKDMASLQKAVMGMDPGIKPFEALAELQTRVKREKMKQSMQAQNPEQPPVAQRMMSEAAALQNPYMASGLAAAPVESPVGMAGGGIVAFDEGGEVRHFVEGGWNKYAPSGYGNTLSKPPTEEEIAEYNRLSKMGLGETFAEYLGKARNAVAGMFPDTKPLVQNLQTTTRTKVSPESVGATLDAEDARGVPEAGVTQQKADTAPAGLAAAAARGAAGAGAGVRAPVGLAAAAGRGGYDTDFKPQTDEERIAAMQKYKAAMGAQNEEFLRPLQERLTKYEAEATKNKEGAMADALVQAGLGMMAGKSQYALQNIGEGGMSGLAALRESKKLDQAAQEKLMAAQGDMAKSRIALEKGDEQTAATLANQGRQEQQAAAQFKLLGQHYANQDAASMAQAQAYMARANALGGNDGKQRLNELKALQATLQKQLDPKQNPMLMLQKNAGEKAGLQSQLAQVNAAIAQMAGLGTIPPQASPAGGGSGAKFLGFE